MGFNGAEEECWNRVLGAQASSFLPDSPKAVYPKHSSITQRTPGLPFPFENLPVWIRKELQASPSPTRPPPNSPMATLLQVCDSPSALWQHTPIPITVFVLPPHFFHMQQRGTGSWWTEERSEGSSLLHIFNPYQFHDLSLITGSAENSFCP